MGAAQKAIAPAAKIARPLLAWYDAHARRLPWRIGPAARHAGEAQHPYRVWLSEIMLQQTGVATVTGRFAAFVARWPDFAALAAAPIDDVLEAWAGLGYYARARNLHRCAIAVARDHGGELPRREEALRALPGIGPYTAAAIAAIAFDERAIVVDGNVLRVMARLFAVKAPLPGAKRELRALAASVWPARRSGDFAQGLMDLGATVCMPRRPDCGACPIARHCAAYRGGRPEAYPRRAARAKKPTRYGVAYALFNAKGEVLLERRPDKGLLGGMLGLPTTEWTLERPNGIDASPARRAGRIVHAFTHFKLELDVYSSGASPRRRLGAHERWADVNSVRLPTVMKKALALAAASRPFASLEKGGRTTARFKRRRRPGGIAAHPQDRLRQ